MSGGGCRPSSFQGPGRRSVCPSRTPSLRTNGHSLSRDIVLNALQTSFPSSYSLDATLLYGLGERCPGMAEAREGSFHWFWLGGLSPSKALPGRVPPCGQGGSLRDGGGELMGGSRGGGCLKTEASERADLSSGECLSEGTDQDGER